MLRSSLQVLEGCSEVSPEPFILQAKQAQLPQSFFTGEVLQPFYHSRCPFLDLIQHHLIHLMLGAPGLDEVLQRDLHNSRVKGDNHLPHPAGQPLLQIYRTQEQCSAQTKVE